MSTSIVVLKTGEKIITDLQEAFNGDDENKTGICLIMRHPYQLSLAPAEDDDELDLKVEFTKWCPYAIDTEFKIPYDSVISIATPDPTLAEAFEAKIERIEETVIEQTTNFAVQQKAIQEALMEMKSKPPVK
jgi:hypothetical protein